MTNSVWRSYQQNNKRQTSYLGLEESLTMRATVSEKKWFDGEVEKISDFQPSVRNGKKKFLT